jgi:hypothetical protein
MSVCQLQVNSATTVQGVNLLTGTYADEEHRLGSADEAEAEAATYTLRLPSGSSGDGTVNGVQIVRSGAVTVIR